MLYGKRMLNCSHLYSTSSASAAASSEKAWPATCAGCQNRCIERRFDQQNHVQLGPAPDAGSKLYWAAGYFNKCCQTRNSPAVQHFQALGWRSRSSQGPQSTATVSPAPQQPMQHFAHVDARSKSVKDNSSTTQHSTSPTDTERERTRSSDSEASPDCGASRSSTSECRISPCGTQLYHPSTTRTAPCLHDSWDS